MDLWQLNIFCRVIEHKSFSKAGSRVHLSQPTVSSHIKDLEEHFECKLIDRRGKEALPTKAGDLLYKYAKKLLSLRDKTEMALAEFKGMKRGHLVVGGSTIPGGYILPEIIGTFINKYPEVTIALEIGDTGKIISEIIDGSVEIAVVGAETNDKHILQEKIIDDEMCLLVPKGHKWGGRQSVTYDMLKDEPFIMREDGSGTLKSLQLIFEKSGGTCSDLNVVATMGNTAAICQGIKSRVGVSIMSPKAVVDDLREGRLKALSITGIDLKRYFYLTTHKNRTNSPLCTSFEALLKEAV